MAYGKEVERRHAVMEDRPAILRHPGAVQPPLLQEHLEAERRQREVREQVRPPRLSEAPEVGAAEVAVCS
jgi:hypothetical protein